MFFFFQAEDGIRDIGVTGVQTCALPISGGVVSALGIDHALGEGAGVNQFGQGCRVVVILLVELLLCPDYDAHVGKSGGFGVGACGVALELWLVGGRGSLGGWRGLSLGDQESCSK